MKKPNPKDYGYENNIGEPSGWNAEGGEDAYYDAIELYDKTHGYSYCQSEIEEDGKCPVQCEQCIKYYDNLENSKEIL